MRKLLHKEIVLCTNVQIILFTLFSLFILIPSWPPAIALIYPLSGFMTLFPISIANKDIEYTSLLPIRKSDIVKGKSLYLVFIEVIVLTLAIIGGIIRLLINPVPTEEKQIIYYMATRPSLSLIGFSLLSFGLMNLILISLYYRNPFKRLTGPNLISLISCILVLGIGTVVIALVPVFQSYDTLGIIIQSVTILVGLIFYLLFTYLGYRIGAKALNNIDL